MKVFWAETSESRLIILFSFVLPYTSPKMMVADIENQKQQPDLRKNK